MAVIVLAALVALGGSLFAQQAPLPDGPGKEILEKQCSTCHTIDVIIANRHDADEWKRLVLSMIDRGAEVTEEQVPVIIEYLATNWGKPAASH